MTEEKKQAILDKLITTVVWAILASVGFGSNEAYQKYQADDLGVEVGLVGYANEQLEFYKRNEICMTDVSPFIVTGHKGLKIRVLSCPSGDVRIITEHPETRQRVSKWVTSPMIADSTQNTISLFSKAYADTQIKFTEINQDSVCGVYRRGSHIIEVVKTPYGCFELTYDAMGRLVGELQVKCPC